MPSNKEPIQILSCAIGYTPDRIREFLASFREKTIHSELTLFVHKKHTHEYEQIKHPRIRFQFVDHKIAKKQHVQEIALDYLLTFLRLRSKVDARVYPVMCGRHFYYLEFLKDQGGVFGEDSTIMLTDSRDVIFQRDPDPLSPAVDIQYALEDKLIREEKRNRRWIADLFGERLASELEQFPVSCAGTTMARKDTMLAYLKQMTDNLLSNRALVCRRTCYDQGSHNQIVRKGGLPNPAFCDPCSDNIATLASSSTLNVSIENSEIRINEEIPAVIHQWDRHPKLSEFISKFYAN
jgi:hypothetical protein